MLGKWPALFTALTQEKIIRCILKIAKEKVDGNVLHYTVSHLFFIEVHRIVYHSQARGWNRIIILCCLARRYHALDYMERTA